MKEQDLIDLLKSVKENKIQISEAVDKLKFLPYQDIEFAKIDNHREIRTGYPEVIFCQGKTMKQIDGIVKSMMKKGHNILATRASEEVKKFLKKKYKNLEYYPEAKIVFIKNSEIKINKNKILVITAGTSDIPIAEEAAVTAEKLGNRVDRMFDVGVAGLHRLLHNLPKLNEASVLIVVAGMEGALASVVGGMTDKPIIAVPTSVGYGANFGGLSALLTMLNSCASGVGVVNIDNGFGAGFLASLIIKQIEKNMKK